MTADPLSRQAALQRTFEAGKRSGAWGTQATVNPFIGKPSMREEHDAWAAGHNEGHADWKRRKGK